MISPLTPTQFRSMLPNFMKRGQEWGGGLVTDHRDLKHKITNRRVFKFLDSPFSAMKFTQSFMRGGGGGGRRGSGHNHRDLKHKITEFSNDDFTNHRKRIFVITENSAGQCFSLY